MERVLLPMEPVEPRIASFFTSAIFAEVLVLRRGPYPSPAFLHKIFHLLGSKFPITQRADAVRKAAFEEHFKFYDTDADVSITVENAALYLKMTDTMLGD